VIKKEAIFWVISLTTLILGTASIMPSSDGGKSLIGEIINGTGDSGINEQLQVSLTVYSEESVVRSYETASDREGLFTFSGIELTPGDLIIAETEYLGVTYSSDEVLYDSSQDLPELEIVIYETTNNPADVRISRYDILINRVGNQLRIGEYYLISNQGELTWIGESNLETGRLSTLEFIIPDVAQNLWFSGEGLGERYFDTRRSFVDTKPIQPGNGTVEVFLSYELPFSDSFELVKNNTFPIEEVEIMVSEASAVAIGGKKIESEGTIETDMGTAYAFSAGPIQANENLKVEITDSLAGSKNSKFMEVLSGIFFMSAAIVCVYWFWLRSDKKELPDQASPLLQKIAALDQKYHIDQISKKSYLQQRKELKEEIKHLKNIRR